MLNWTKPVILTSKCLVEEKCRYDGQPAIDKMVKHLNGFAEFILVCPETGVGMGVPRETIRLVGIDQDNISIVQPATNYDYTNKMKKYADEFLSSLSDVDGIIMKTKSPTCGLNGVKIYNDTGKASAFSKKGRGFFAREAMMKFPEMPFEDEGRLTNLRIREHFLTRVFMSSKLRKVKHQNDIEGLREFHSQNNLMLKAYGAHTVHILDGIVENKSELSFEVVYENYKHWLRVSLNRIPEVNSVVSVLNMCLNTFSGKLTKEELEFERMNIEKYKSGKAPLSIPISLIKLNAIRFGNEYLLNQTFLEPFPQELVILQDSGKENMR